MRLAGVIAAFVIASSGGDTQQQQPIEEESLGGQVDRLRDFVNENTR